MKIMELSAKEKAEQSKKIILSLYLTIKDRQRFEDRLNRSTLEETMWVYAIERVYPEECAIITKGIAAGMANVDKPGTLYPDLSTLC